MRKIPYIAAMLLFIALYLLGQQYWDAGALNNTVATILAIVAAVAFWLEFKSNEQINEAQLVMELNNQFINNEKMSEVEWVLEKYYHAYREAKRAGADASALVLDMKLEITDRTRQDLVNYLVYLEGIATLVNEGVLHLNVITELMAYRYFIAVNNPIVQKLELLPYKDYYQGCFKIYEKWSKELGENKVPMREYALVKPADKINKRRM